MMYLVCKEKYNLMTMIEAATPQLSNDSSVSKADEDDQHHLLMGLYLLLFNNLVTFCYTFFYRQLDFPSEPIVANEILENEP